MLDDYSVRGPVAAPDFSPVRGRRLLIALSGGADSVALAVMLAEARAEYGLTLFAAHVDHGIRPESAEDAAFCRDLCARLEIPLFCARVDVPAEAQRARRGLETAARECRYAQLRRLMAQTESDCIALAHHMDDQAETVLMHLFRGAGIDGLGGMRTLDDGERLYRPLLGLRKAELVEYLRTRGQGWREDATNQVPDNPRNALRLNAIPEMERWYPGLVRAVARCAETAQVEGDFLAEATRGYLETCGDAGPFGAWLELKAPPHPAILRRAIIARCPEALSWEQVNSLEAMCRKARGKIDLGEGAFAERTGHRLYFVPKRLPSIEAVLLDLNGETRLDPIGCVTASPAEPVPLRNDPMRQVLKRSTLEGAVLRTRREGDRIRPLGGGDKLLSDYFIDRKVDRPLRDAVPLLAVGNRVHWVCGIGISQEAALTPCCEATELVFTGKYTVYDGGKQNAQ